MSLTAYLQLAMTTGLGPITINRLIETFGSAEAAARASAAELQSIDGIGSSKARAIHQGLQSAKAEAAAEIEKATQLGLSLICPADEVYPILLKSIPDPPAVLYVKGAFEPRDLNGIAIVGSRKCSFYGREQSERFAALLAGAGFTVISGGARGIDSAAHRGALSHANGRTIAVCGSGLDVPYPPENASLFDQIAQRGVVISEYPLGTPPLAENFPRRNRIVSGLSRAVLVIEADIRSGALITARQAAEDHNRPVLAIPGRVDNPLSAGPHKLIREGAALVTNLEEIIEALGPLPHGVAEPSLFSGSENEGDESSVEPGPTEPVVSTVTEQQQTILNQIDGNPVGVETLVERTGLAPQIILQELTLLSLKGSIRRIDGQTYARRRT